MKKISGIKYRWSKNNLSQLCKQYEKDMEFLLTMVGEMENVLNFYSKYSKNSVSKTLIEEDCGKKARKILAKLNSPL